MERRNIQVGNFFWYEGEIVQVYDLFVGEFLQDYDRKNLYLFVNKKGEFLAGGDEDLKDVLLSNELLEYCFYKEEQQDETKVGKDYMVTRTIEHISIHWNPIRILAELSFHCWETKVKEDKRWFANAESVRQLQNILNALNDMDRIHDISDCGNDIVYNTDMKLKQFLWRENDDRE